MQNYSSRKKSIHTPSFHTPNCYKEQFQYVDPEQVLH